MYALKMTRYDTDDVGSCGVIRGKEVRSGDNVSGGGGQSGWCLVPWLSKGGRFWHNGRSPAIARFGLFGSRYTWPLPHLRFVIH